MAVGDVCGERGLGFLATKLRSIKNVYGIAFCIVNGENAAVFGITPRQADDIFRAGADVITLGNHTWSKREIIPYLDDNSFILRPANFAPQVAGRGWGEYETSFGMVRVVNLIGRCAMPNFGPENPFFEADRILKKNDPMITLVDFHAEATSEKQALGYYLDGRVSAVWGTHTHVQTSDGMILPNGTGYVTDIGMTGPINSIIGIKPEQSVSMFLGEPPARYESGSGSGKMECCIFEIDTSSLKCVSVETLRITD